MSSLTSRGKSLLAFVIFFAATWLAAAIGILSSQNAPVIYKKIVQPSWAPPSSVFGPVWSTLYCLMAIAAWLVWRQRDRLRVNVCLGAYFIHLLFQAAWSWLFFGLGRADLAMFDILLLWLMIVWLMLAFWRVDRLAGILMLPYLLWVSFASVLNGALWMLNGGILPR
jgi:tryptophan-rich sensory protein